MSTVTQPLPIPLSGETVRLDGISWDEYVAMADAIPESTFLRTAFHGDRLEVMTVSPEHDKYSRLLDKLITILCVQANIDFVCGGSSTFRSELLKQGVEPDECYWVAHAAEVIGIKRWSPERYPAPDLVVEIDIISDSLNRRPIFANLGIPEMWRFDGRQLSPFILNDEQQYVPATESLAFPFLTVTDLEPFVAKLDQQSDTAIIREFMQWCTAQGFDDA